MDKETLSNYGWIVICVLVLAVMLALATPFGNFIADGFKAAFLGLGQTNNSMLDTMFDATGTPPSLEYLQNKYQFEYYSTVNLAVTDVNNGTIGASADSDKSDAVAGIYTDENGSVNVVLLQDTTEATTISPAVDMTINLGGHVLSSTDTIGLNITAGNVAIDGRLNGSTIQINHTQSTKARTILVDAGATLTVDSGTYICSTEGDSSRCILSQGNLTLSNATVIGTETTGTIRTIQVQGDAANISKCSVTATVNEGVAMGVAVSGPTTISDCSITATGGQATAVYSWAQANTATVSNCTINAYSNYTDGTNGFFYFSCGINNNCTMTLNNCYVMGVHSGVQSKGTLYVNGGTYEGYSHGGFYFSGSDITSYVRNATIRECAVPNGYSDLGGGTNHAGFYIGGSSGRRNIAVYMDNCDITANEQPIVLRGTSGEQNTSLYISNSTITRHSVHPGGEWDVRIDNDTHRLYIGQNCNFDISDCAPLPSQPQFDMSTAVFETNETYIMN